MNAKSIGVLLLSVLATLNATPRILLDQEATAYEQFAAQELQRVWQQATGIQPQIQRNQTPQPQDMVIATADKTIIRKQAPRLKLDSKRKFEAVIQELDGILYLVGQTPRTTVDATMLFLQEHLGARWLWPGPDGEFIPQKQDIPLKGISRRHNPHFTQRNIGRCGYDHTPADFELFMSHNFSTIAGCTQYDLPQYVPKNSSRNVEFIRSRARQRGLQTSYGGHTTFHDVPVKQRPELYALRNGKRIYEQLCWSHPDNPSLVADHMISMARKFNCQDIGTFSLSVHDNEQYCQCPLCLQAIKNGSSYSRLYFQFADAVARELKKRQPGVQVGSLAYLAYATPPGIPLKHLDWINYCPWHRCYSHRSNQCSLNRKSYGEAKEWADTGIEVHIYGYLFDSISPAVALPWQNLIKDELESYRAMGIRKVSPELMLASPRNVSTDKQSATIFRLSTYLYLQLLYRPDLTVKDIIEDWCRTAYGPEAGKDMFMYHRTLIRGFDQVKQHLSGLFSRPNAIAEELFAMPGLTDTCEGLLKSAVAKATVPRYRKNLDYETQLYMQMKKMATFTLHETFLPVPYCQDDGTRLTAKLGSSGATMHYTPQALVFTLTGPAQINLQTVHDEHAGIRRHITVNQGHVTYQIFQGDRPRQGKDKALKLTSQENSSTLTIPFTALEIAPPLAGETWRLKLHTGGTTFPQKRKLPPANSDYAYIVFNPTVKESPHTMLVMPDQKDNKRKTAGFFRDTATQYGFSVDFALNTADVERDLAPYDVILLKLKTGSPSTAFFQGPLLQAARRGALVILAGETMSTPLETSFGDESYRFQVHPTLLAPSFKIVEAYRACTVQPRTPNYGNQYPTRFAYSPVHFKDWFTLFTALDQTKTPQPIMCWRTVGRGAIIVTSCEMGLYHGWRVFGDLAPQAPDSTFQLILNLLDHRPTPRK